MLAGLPLGSVLAAEPAPAPPSQAGLLAILTSNVPLAEKSAAAQQLAQSATRDAVPKLAVMLDDDQIADLARSVLEAIPDSAAGTALREALDRVRGQTLVGVIGSLGMRRDALAVAPLARLLRTSDPAVGLACAAALGRIGTLPAATALEEAIPGATAGLRVELYADLIECADALEVGGRRTEAVGIYRHVGASTAPAVSRASAVRGVLLAGETGGFRLLAGMLNSDDPSVFAAALGLVQADLPGVEVSAALAVELRKLSAAKQVSLLQALGVRSDAAAARALGEAARTGPPSLRLAALGAMAGNRAFVPILSEIAGDADPSIAKAAQTSLASVPGSQADAAVLAMLDGDSAGRRLVGIQLASRRRLVAAVPKLLKMVGLGDPALSRLSLEALGRLAGEADLPGLLVFLSGPGDEVDQASLERALAGTCSRAKNPETCAQRLIDQMPGANPKSRGLLLRVLGSVGGARALQAVRAAVSDANDDTRRTAIHTLALWPNVEAAGTLLEFAQTLPNPAERLVCLRGYLSMAGNEELGGPQRLAMCRQALALSDDPQAKKLLLSALTGLASADALALALPALANPATTQEAGAAILSVAGALLAGSDAAAQVPAVIDPLYQVTQTSPPVGLASRAKALLQRAFQVQGPRGAGPGPVRFVMHRIGHFRSEACGVADFNGDGKLDVVAGDYLYLAPDWKPVKIRTVKGSVDDQGKGYRWDFANLPVTVEGTGRPDLVSVDWFGKHAVWCHNVGVAGGDWPESLIDENGSFEMAHLEDVVGDGKRLAVVPAVTNTVWYELVRGSGEKNRFTKHVVSTKSMNWGVGVGDINGDGRPDFIRPDAWFEAPADPRNGQWIEHPLALGALDGKADHTPQILVYDVNGDGLNDIITSCAHGYGIFWYEQVRHGKEITFRQHLIDASWTQAHSLALADLDGCGVPELITGKRFMAHNGGDPEEDAPLGLYYYKLSREPVPVWTKHIISYAAAIGSGVNICVADLDGDGDLDIVVTGKWGGPVWFENQRLSRKEGHDPVRPENSRN